MKDQGGGRARMMDDLAGVAGGAFSVLTGIRAEIEAIAKAQAEAIIRRLDLVRREELDAAMDVAQTTVAGCHHVLPVAALWAVAGPAAQSLMTARVSPSEQGRLQGAIGSLNSIAGILGPTLFTQTLAFVAANELRGPMAGASFWLAAVMVSLGGLLAWRVTTTRP